MFDRLLPICHNRGMQTTSENRAVYIGSPEWGTGDVRLYYLNPPLKLESGGSTNYVAISATVAHSGPETYIFACDISGEPSNWMELAGSFRGGLDHIKALTNIGYVVADPEGDTSASGNTSVLTCGDIMRINASAAADLDVKADDLELMVAEMRASAQDLRDCADALLASDS